MKKTILFLLSLLLVGVQGVWAWDGSGTQDDPYKINSASDWNTLCTNVNDGTNTYSGQYFKLTDNISVTTMVGAENHSFNGTFDGDGHTISVEITTSAEFSGPFAFTYGATIKNLITTGTINTSAKHTGGVVGRNGSAKLTLENVKSNVTINSTVNGSAEHGGLVGYAINADIIGCAFTGSLLGESSTGCGGLIGWKSNTDNSSANITNCLFAPANVTASTTNAFTFVRTPSQGTISVTNCYYSQTLGTEQGKLRHSIAAGSNVTVANAAAAAAQYNVSGLTFYGAGFKFNDVLYASSADKVSLTLGYTLPGYNVSYSANNGTLTGSGNPYTLPMPDANVTISATTTAAEWEGNGDSWETAYLIYNKDQFKLLASRVNNGTSNYANKYFKLMTDFTISITGNNSDATTANDMANNLVGVSTTNTFNGHFDGNGHKITLNFTTENTGNHYIAPFRYTNGAEIKNLHIAGKSTCRIYEASGIIGHAQGNNSISGCYVNANFTVASNQSTANQTPTNLECTTLHGTFISYVASGNNVIEGCLFDGSIAVRQGSVTSITWYNDYGAGFVGGSASGASVTVRGCVFKPTSVDSRFRNANTFVAGDATVNVTNSYYIDYPLATVQGKRMRSFAPADEHVTITASTPAAYSVSGITTYTDCIYWNYAFRAGEADEVSLTLSNDLGYNGYEVNAGSIARNGTNWTLTMPDEDVTISAIYDWAGSGTQGDPYIISTTNDLDLLATRINNGTSNYTGKYFQLANNLAYDYSTLGSTESNYTAIGCILENPSNPEEPIERYFDGNFNGQGFTISGIRINDTDGMCKGLFGYNRSNAVVRNVTLSDSEITGSMMVGGIVGYNLGGTITNCRVTNSVVLHGMNSNTMDFGGIAGTNAQTTSVISNCTSSASFTVTGEEGYISREFGGLVGANIGTLSHNLVIGSTIPGCGSSSHGAIAGGSGNNLSNNYYVNCTVAGVANATGVGIGSKAPINVGDPYETYDVTENDGAVNGLPTLRDNADNTDAIALLANASPILGTINVTIQGRTLWKDGDWNTLCLPFSMTAEQVAAQLAPATDGLMELDTENAYNGHKTGIDGTTLYLNFKNASSIVAGTPYIIKWESGSNIVNPTFTGITVSNETHNVSFTGGQFLGTYGYQQFTTENQSILFMGTNNTLFYPQPSDLGTDNPKYPTIGAFRAYFHLEANQARSFVLNFDDETVTTGIISMEDGKLKMEDATGWYTIDGRKLNGKPTKSGMYINNGLKVVIK